MNDWDVFVLEGVCVCVGGGGGRRRRALPLGSCIAISTSHSISHRAIIMFRFV
jgi:hypothetical protein